MSPAWAACLTQVAYHVPEGTSQNDVGAAWAAEGETAMLKTSMKAATAAKSPARMPPPSLSGIAYNTLHKHGPPFPTRPKAQKPSADLQTLSLYTPRHARILHQFEVALPHASPPTAIDFKGASPYDGKLNIARHIRYRHDIGKGYGDASKRNIPSRVCGYFGHGGHWLTP